MGLKRHVIGGVVLAAFAAGLTSACTADAADPLDMLQDTEAPRRPVFCYVETLFDGAAATDLDFRPCTHVIEAFVIVDSSGAIRPVNGLPRPAIIAAARSAGARVLVSVGGATVPGTTFSSIARDQLLLQRFTRELSDFVVRAGYDGVDLDWEFPSPAEANLHLAFVRAVKSALSTRSPQPPPTTTRPRPPRFRGRDLSATRIITVPVAGYWIPSYNLAALHDEVDYVILMGYDFRNPALGPWANDAKLWPVDAHTPIEGSVRGAAAEMIRNGLGHDKLIISLPFYSSANQPWVEVRERALASTSPLHPLFLEKLIDGVWITDPEALGRKIAAAVSGFQISGGNAAGIAVWQLGHQGKHRDLSEAMLRALARP
jgi:spore germination protein YaaH